MTESYIHPQTAIAQTTTIQGATNMQHESESPSVSTALQHANEEKKTHCMSATQYGGTVALNGHGMEFARVVSEYKLWVQIIQDSSLERC
jgi:hypothetical protein